MAFVNKQLHKFALLFNWLRPSLSLFCCVDKSTPMPNYQIQLLIDTNNRLVIQTSAALELLSRHFFHKRTTDIRKMLSSHNLSFNSKSIIPNFFRFSICAANFFGIVTAHSFSWILGIWCP